MTNDESIEFSDLDDVQGESELTPPEVYASNLIEWAVDRHSSDLFVSDNEKCVVVSVRRLGKIETVRRIAKDYGRKLQGHLRVLGGSDAGESVRPSDGRGVVVTPNGCAVDLRLSCMPTLHGQDVAIRLFDPIRGARSLDRLGLDDAELGIVHELLDRPSGLILVSGPVASGKSSTQYALIDHLNDGTRKLHTIEDPIEHALSGVMQSQVNLRAGLDFADLLSAVLRHSPDVIMIGEIRDVRTAATAVRAGVSGQLVLATLHAKSAAEAVDTMLQYETNPKFLASSLIGVINQRLIRRICPACRRPVENEDPLPVSDRVRNRLGEGDAQLYQVGGCDECFDDGFTSLTCLPEIMPVGPELSQAIADQAPSGELERIAASGGMLTLAEAATGRVLRGVTTAYEASRAVTDPGLASLVAIARNAARS